MADIVEHLDGQAARCGRVLALVSAAFTLALYNEAIRAATERRPLKAVFSQPRCAAATFVGATSYASMVFLMAALPLAMNQDSFSFADSSTAIQVHMVLMFLPSFGTGHAIKKLGVSGWWHRRQTTSPSSG